MVDRWVYILMAFALGCSETRAGGPQAQVVDSAGVRTITYDLTAVEPPVYRSVGEHDLEIGVIEGTTEYAFSRILDVAVVGDEMIAIADGGTQEIRIFTDEGRFLRNVGQRGEGPGEFAGAPTIAGTAGDTLFAFDNRGGRVTSFTADGQSHETVTIRAGNGNRVSALMRRSDGSYLAQSRWIAPDQEPVFHDVRLELDSVVVEHLSRAGQVVDTLKVMGDRNRARVVEDRGGGRIGVIQADPPHLPRAFFGSDGTQVVAGRSDSFNIETLLGGGPPMVLRVLGADHPASAADILSRQEAAIREDLGDGPMDPRTRQLNLGFLPERLPAFSDLSVSEAGDIWVAMTEFDGSEGYDWLVFSSTGELRGSVHTPAGLRLFVIRPTHLIGVVIDDLDVPYVRRYPLLIPDGNRP